MTYVVAEPCVKCKYTDCVAVCPVAAFREGANFLVIDPDVCIDCDLCVPECPVEAIFALDDVPEGKESWIQINADKCESDDVELITESTDPLPTAEEKKAALGL